ncbi:Protein of unknown function [Gryllus bimaculatus]|nr:Protein of unknown function [Gryllus bimaculatus]
MCRRRAPLCLQLLPPLALLLLAAVAVDRRGELHKSTRISSVHSQVSGRNPVTSLFTTVRKLIPYIVITFPKKKNKITWSIKEI